MCTLFIQTIGSITVSVVHEAGALQMLQLLFNAVRVSLAHTTLLQILFWISNLCTPF